MIHPHGAVQRPGEQERPLFRAAPWDLLPPLHAYWREFVARNVTALCVQEHTEAPRQELRVASPADEQLERVALAAPIIGAEWSKPIAISLSKRRPRKPPQ